ncbi:MAG: hypothetical protein JW808_09240 [Victivallales bacterium]|nr:hypothetical protein [Victivallales bacterium]
MNLIHAQMQQHYVESASAYEAHVTQGFRALRANNYTAAADENDRSFRSTIPEGQRNRIGAMFFSDWLAFVFSLLRCRNRFSSSFSLPGDSITIAASLLHRMQPYPTKPFGCVGFS